MSRDAIAARVEGWIRRQFAVAEADPGFSRSRRLFDGGYIDSVGFVELLEFLRDEFGVSVPDDLLLSDEFATIDGIAGVVERLRAA